MCSEWEGQGVCALNGRGRCVCSKWEGEGVCALNGRERVCVL